VNEIETDNSLKVTTQISAEKILKKNLEKLSEFSNLQLQLKLLDDEKNEQIQQINSIYYFIYEIKQNSSLSCDISAHLYPNRSFRERCSLNIILSNKGKLDLTSNWSIIVRIQQICSNDSYISSYTMPIESLTKLSHWKTEIPLELNANFMFLNITVCLCYTIDYTSEIGDAIIIKVLEKEKIFSIFNFLCTKDKDTNIKKKES